MCNYKSGVSLEDIPNNTICVKTTSGIRNMKFEEDIEANLVWVCQVFPVNEEIRFSNMNRTISKGTYIRYLDIHVFTNN